jgi:hypothetical protein
MIKKLRFQMTGNSGLCSCIERGSRRASAACDSGNLRRVSTNKVQNPRGAEEPCFRPSGRAR